MPQHKQTTSHAGARPLLRYIGVLAVLLLAMGLTRVVSEVHTTRLRSAAESARSALVGEAESILLGRFEAVQQEMLQLAERVAGESHVGRVLRSSGTDNRGESSNPDHLELIDWFSGLSPGRYHAIELFDSHGDLLAWNGFGMPRDSVIAATATKLTTRNVRDDANREALVLWLPITDGARVLGRVRVLRLATVPVNVPSQYLQPYSLAEELSRHIKATVNVRFGDSFLPAILPASDAKKIALPGRDGAMLGAASIYPPDAEDLVAAAQGRYDNVICFWSALVAFWFLFGAWRSYRTWLSETRRNGNAVRFRDVLIVTSVIAAGTIGFRFALLLLNIPARWFPDSPLFDPRHLASSFGLGVAQSIGDLLISTVVWFILVIWIVKVTLHVTFPNLRGFNAGLQELRDTWLAQRERTSWPRMIAATALMLVAVLALSPALASLSRSVIFDSTLDYFAWTGLSPEPLVLSVFAALVTWTLASALAIAAVFRGYAWWIARYRDDRSAGKHLLALGLPSVSVVAAAYAVTDLNALLPWMVALMLWTFALFISLIGAAWSGNFHRVLSVKVFVLITLVSSAIVYPLVYEAMMRQRQIRMEDVADDFVARKDAELKLVINHALDAAMVETTDRGVPPAGSEGMFDAVELPILDEYRLTLTLLNAEERPVYGERFPSTGIPVEETQWRGAFGLLRARLAADSSRPRQIGWVSQSIDGSQNTFAGLTSADIRSERVWILATATPRTVRFARQDPDAISHTMFGYDDWRSMLSLAEYRLGRLVRTEGTGFENNPLPPPVAQALESRPSVWHEETVFGTPYLTYYRLQQEEDDETTSPVIAVRARSVISYDHLYYYLRITFAGLWVGLIGYLVGWILRRRRLIRPRGETRFRDKVIDAFMIVGSVAVVLMGLIGQQVIQRENQGAVQSRLERRLLRVANALDRYAGDGMPMLHAFDSISVNALADELSLDLNVYTGPMLTGSSSTAEQEKLLVYSRLPIQAYREIYLKGHSKSFVTLSAEGRASYTMGYLGLPDESGYPAATVAVLTIPEQARIQEERARTTAYLYGALLILLLLIMATAMVLANTLTRPIRHLRDGLVTVAAGSFHRPIPVESNDEVGGLVRSFNEMQEQLAESRRKLAQHEREIAWREMAKQVAHEIKNPLTPMKLSVQHLQRAYDISARSGDDSDDFGTLFRRITSTLISQIDTLAHIANEFYTFARMPRRHLERLDVNESVQKSVNLFRDENRVAIELHLWRDPLYVEGDSEELQRVIINLIKNGIQAISPEEPGTVTVHLWAEGTSPDKKKEIFCSVSDTGKGIPEEARDRIFQPNFSTKTSGMGLGLAIVKKTVEAMDGEVTFQSREGGGTTFTLRFPAAD